MFFYLYSNSFPLPTLIPLISLAQFCLLLFSILLVQFKSIHPLTCLCIGKKTKKKLFEDYCAACCQIPVIPFLQKEYSMKTGRTDRLPKGRTDRWDVHSVSKRLRMMNNGWWGTVSTAGSTSLHAVYIGDNLREQRAAFIMKTSPHTLLSM